MKRKTVSIRKPIQISAEAHRAAQDLVKAFQKEKGLTRVTLQDAVSLAVLEALARRENSSQPQA